MIKKVKLSTLKENKFKAMIQQLSMLKWKNFTQLNYLLTLNYIYYAKN